jgi:Flp pilus assembly protein TadG
MTTTQKLKSLFKRFKADQNGTVALIVSLAAVPLMIIAGSAIDYAQFSAAQTQTQAALDAGALAGAAARDVSDSKRIEFALATFNENIKTGPASHVTVTPSFTIEDKVVISKASVEVPTALMKIVGIGKMTGVSHAEVSIAQEKKAEIVMALDYSGSMEEVSGGKVKYIAMRDAATKLVNDLSATSPDKVKFGLVPFSHHVYTTLPAANVLGATTPTWTGCTQDREYPSNISASTPTTDPATKWNQPQAPVHAKWGCDGYVSNHLTTIDLTDKFSKVTNQLSKMKPYAWTHIALGVEFGYHMLSPNAPYTQGAAFSDSGTKKFLVVLTDGAQTEPGFGPAGSRNVANGEANLTKLCTSAKANGITIITMAFDLDDSTTRKRLQACATDPTKDFFIANDDADLEKAFETVKSAITADLFLSK